MDLITVDFETYYDQEYSLSKMTTEEYIRDERFEIIGVGVRVNNNPTEWASGTHEQLAGYFEEFDWENSTVLAHNTMFDGAILSWHFGINPKFWADTLCMARAMHGVEVGGSLAKLAQRYAIGEKGTEVINAKGKRRKDFTPEELSRYGDYCINDVDLTVQLFKIMGENYPKKELRLIDRTLRMFTNPLLELDEELLRDHLDMIKYEKAGMLAASGFEDRKALMSNQKFADALRELGVEPPMKTSPTTGKQTYAFAKTDKAFLALQDHEDQRVQILVTTRLGLKSTLEETRTERFQGIAERGSMPVPIRYCAAHTTRWGGDDKINLQNLPSRGPNGKVLKRAIVAPPGYAIVDCDSSQIEARVLAWIAGQDDLVAAFANGEDVYVKMAASIYEKPESEITKEERFVGKTTILGCGYGMGARRFREQLGQFGVEVSEDEAARIIFVYRRTNKHIVEFWKLAGRVLKGLHKHEAVMFDDERVLAVNPMAGVRLPSGLLIRYDDIQAEQGEYGLKYTYKTRYGRSRIYGGKLVENWTQGIARCVIGEQMLKIAERYTPVLTVHDSIASLVPLEEVAEGQAYIEKCMRYVPTWAKGLPLDCEAFTALRYGDCHEDSEELLV